MLLFVVRRVLLILPILFGLLLLTFVMLRLAPGDPAAAIAGANATPQQIAAIRAEIGLDKPVFCSSDTTSRVQRRATSVYRPIRIARSGWILRSASRRRSS